MRHPLLIICLSQLCVSLGMAMADPFMAIYASSFGISYSVVGLVMSSFGLTRVFVEIPGGILVDRIGRRPLILVGSAISTASHLIAGLAQSFIEVMVSRMAVGVGSALLYTASLTYVGEIAPEGKRSRFIAIFQSVFSIAGVIGPTLGGLISESFSIRTIFFASVLLSLIGFLFLLLIRIRETASGFVGAPIIREGFREILKNIRIIVLGASCFMMFFLFSSVRGTLIPLYGVDELGLNSFQIGLVFSLTSAVIVAGLLAISHRMETILGGSLLLSVSLFICSTAVYLISLATDFASLVFSSLYMGLGFSLLQPTPFAMLIDYSSPEYRGLSMGVLRTFGDVGIIIGPILVGWLMDLGQTLWAFYLVAGVVGLFSFISWAVLRELS